MTTPPNVCSDDSIINKYNDDLPVRSTSVNSDHSSPTYAALRGRSILVLNDKNVKPRANSWFFLFFFKGMEKEIYI